MSKNRIYKCLWMQAKLRLESPAIIGSGNAAHTDQDLLTGNDGKPFLPGASLAGIARSLLLNGKKVGREFAEIFGEGKEENCQSIVTFWDGVIPEEESFTIAFRDSVALNEETKTAIDKAKRDFEVLNPGTCFRFRMEIVLREEQKELPILQFVSNLIDCMECGDFRIGGKTTRGYGKVSLEKVQILQKDFSGEKPDDFLEYVNFDWSKLEGEGEIELPSSTYCSPYTKLELLLSPESTLLIRNYFIQNLDVNCEQLQVDGKAVIPGTAWAGLFRHRIQELLIECMDGKENEAKQMIEELFGPKRKTEEKKRARVIFEESADLDAEPKGKSSLRIIMRNKIDRFTGGVLKSALLSERVAVGGKFRLGIRIRDAKAYEIGMILLAIEDLCNGLLAIGGTTAAGRGVMKPAELPRFYIDAEKTWRTLDEKAEQVYWDALDEKIRQRR